MSHKLSIATINISGLSDDKKRKTVFTYLRQHNYDIVFLQETHCHLNREAKKWSLEWDGQSLWSMGTKRSRGVCALFNRNTRYDIKNEIIDYNGRYIIFDLCIGDSMYRFINIYAPNNEYDRVAFINLMSTWIDPDIETIVSGDYNCTLNSELDRLNCIGSRDIGQIDLKNVMNTFDLEDVFRRRNPHDRVYSWKRGNKASRIDYFLVSRSLDNQVDMVSYKICPFSDHSIVNLQMRITETKHGKGVWKMNVNVLESDFFKKCFKHMWSCWQKEKQYYDDIRVWWDLGKKKVKDLCIWCACKISEDRNSKCKEYENMLERLQSDQTQYDEYTRVKNELRKLYDGKGEGAKIRSRIKWHEEGEKSSKYFYGLEKRNGKDKSWECILDKEGNVLYGTENVLKRAVEFYCTLYKSEGVDNENVDLFINSVDKTLSNESIDLLDKNITKTELYSSLKKMKNNKSPGPDGIIVEFYKLFWNEIVHDLFEVFNYSFDVEQLPYTQYIAIIILLYKKGRREDIKNWRPISLLNIDVKILSKVLAERLKKVLNEIINVDQQGCLQGRFIGKNVRLVEDIIEMHDDDEVLLLLDQQKAFDRVEWKWLFKVLDKFKFGEVFKKWIYILYKDMKSTVLINGYTSNYFPISRGIRQGDSLSALLYILQAEPFAEYVRKCNDFEGITVTNEQNESVEIKCCMYVDDTVLFVKDARMIGKCLEVVENYGKASGSKLNKEKTVGIVMNDRLVTADVDTHGIKLTKGPEKFLGVVIGKNIDTSSFWESLIEKMEMKLQIWKTRNLSFQGKVQLIKSIGMSTVLYACEMISVKEKYLDIIEKKLYNFLWDGRSKVRKDIVSLPKASGGLNMIDIRKVVKVKRIRWIIRLLQANPHEPWSFIPLSFMSNLDKKYQTEMFILRVNDVRRIMDDLRIPAFYKECIECIHELYRHRKINDKYEIIWFNNMIRFNGDVLNFRHWSKSGIVYISDVVKNGSIREEYILDRLKQKAGYIFEIEKIKAGIPDKLKHIDYGETNDDLNAREILLDQNIVIPNSGIKPLTALTSKDIYQAVSLNENVCIKSKDYWNSKFHNVNIDFNMWFRVNFTNALIPRNCIDFNWKIFHGIVNTEQKLERMNFSDGICKLCKKEQENLEHLLIKCNKTNDIWNFVQTILCICGFNDVLNNFNVMCGIHYDDPNSNIINMILSIVRFIIWKRRNLNRYENEFTDMLKTKKWIISDIRKHVSMLMFTKLVKKNYIISQKLKSITFVLKSYIDI